MQENKAAEKHKMFAEELSETVTALQMRYQQSQTELETKTEHLELARLEHRTQVEQIQREAQSDAAEKE